MAATPRLLTKKQYTALRRDVEKLLSEAESSASLGKLQAYWRIAVRTLQRAVSLRKAYARLPQKLELSWSHYRLLLPLRSDPRVFYERLAIDQALSARQLARAIGAGLYHVKEGKRRVLVRPVSPEYLYAAKVAQIVDGDTVDLDVDLGFSVSVRQRIRFAHIDAPEIDTAEGRAARDFLAAELVAGRTVVVQTRKADLHGRYVAEVFVSTQEVGIEACFGQGTYLNDRLVTEGHARVVG